MISLTATELPRFMSCNGSYLLQGIKPFEQDTAATDEGIAVHWLIEQVFRGHHTAEVLIDRKAPNGVFITADMVEHSEAFIEDMRGGSVEIDTSCKTNKWEIRGRADAIKSDESALIVSDFKYGWKIVEPEKNWTLIHHAYGFSIRNPTVPIDTIIFKIYQPRPFHPNGPIRAWSICQKQFADLCAELHSALENPDDQCRTSQHCYKCPSITQCPAHQVATANSIDVAYKAYDNEINNSDLSRMLTEIARAADVLKQSQTAYQDLAMHRLKIGQHIPSYSITKSYGHTRWRENMTVDIVKAITGVDCSKKALITPNQAKKAGVSEEVIEVLTERPSSGFRLVNVDPVERARQLFK